MKLKYKYQGRIQGKKIIHHKGMEYEVREYPNDVFLVHRIGTKLTHQVIRLSKRKFECDCQWYRMGFGNCNHIEVVKEYLQEER